MNELDDSDVSTGAPGALGVKLMGAETFSHGLGREAPVGATTDTATRGAPTAEF
jgi:hypothetical protein